MSRLKFYEIKMKLIQKTRVVVSGRTNLNEKHLRSRYLARKLFPARTQRKVNFKKTNNKKTIQGRVLPNI